MWEKDRKVLSAFKECYNNMVQSIEAGEDVDYSSTCVEETEALVSHTIRVMNTYKNSKPQEVSAMKQRYFVPKQPYFQNF